MPNPNLVDPESDHALVALTVLREQRWVYERRMERRTWHEIERLAALPEQRGGLGYPISGGALRSMHRKYVTEMIEIEERTREEHGHLAEAELDRMQHMVEQTLGDTVRHAARIEAPPQLGPVIDAVKVGLKINESRRRLLGLDAPAKMDHSVTVERDLEAEVRALFERGGTEPPREEATA